MAELVQRRGVVMLAKDTTTVSNAIASLTSSGDIEILSSSVGIIMRDSSGVRRRYTMDTSGNWVASDPL
jgi:hypothetical protein